MHTPFHNISTTIINKETGIVNIFHTKQNTSLKQILKSVLLILHNYCRILPRVNEFRRDTVPFIHPTIDISEIKMEIKSKLKINVLSGFTAAMFIGAYSLAMCAAAGFNMLSFVLCTVICAIFSIKNKSKIFAPHPFFIVPVLYVLGKSNALTLILSVALGSLLFGLIKKPLRKIKIPDFVYAGGGLALALTATILLTNLYFGIGANGAEALDMLKSYRSLGFHPNFRGLLYGTVTLFSMITYPFKFKKLNKYIPAEFITLLIPLIMNLFLNSDSELTTVNEIGLFFNGSFNGFNGFFSQQVNYHILFRGTLSIAFLLFAYKNGDNHHGRFTLANTFNGFLTGLPVKEYKIFKYNGISALICIVTLLLWVILFPNIISRIPTHCIGAMLIVAAWQSVPYKNLVASFKKNATLSSIGIIGICTEFILFGTFYGILFCFVITVIEEKKHDKR